MNSAALGSGSPLRFGRNDEEESPITRSRNLARVGFEQPPTFRAGFIAPARVKWTKLCPEARSIGGCDGHAATHQLRGPGGVDRFGVLALQQCIFLDVAFDDPLNFGGERGPGTAIRQQ